MAHAQKDSTGTSLSVSVVLFVFEATLPAQHRKSTELRTQHARSFSSEDYRREVEDCAGNGFDTLISEKRFVYLVHFKKFRNKICC